eukprot:5773163-Prorocentrum_lima.AAC.1
MLKSAKVGHSLKETDVGPNDDSDSEVSDEVISSLLARLNDEEYTPPNFAEASWFLAEYEDLDLDLMHDPRGERKMSYYTALRASLKKLSEP